jgi:DNA-binding Xre family transcriptional regulator
MQERDKIINTLKTELRKQGKTYADLTDVLSLSHASVKRLFAERNFTLDRVELVCRFLGMDIAELVHIMEKNAERLDQLTIEQEQQLVQDDKFLCMAHALLNRWTFSEVIDTYDISEHEGIQFMAKLDKMKLIEMLPGNRYKLLVSRKFNWIAAGPIQRFFEKQLQSDFFNSSFNKEGESRVFTSLMLSRGSADELIRKLKKLGDEANELHLEDEKLPLDQRKGVSLLLAARHWETKVFSSLRRTR